MIKLGLANELKLGNLDARRDWCYAKDAVHAVWLMLQQNQPDDYIIASGETYSVRELAEYAFNCVGLDWQDYVSVDPAFYRPDEPVQLVGCVDRTKTKLAWKPQHSFEQMVELMVNYDLKQLSDTRHKNLGVHLTSVETLIDTASTAFSSSRSI